MDAYIVAAYRSAVGKAPRGKFRYMRPDDLAAEVLKYLVSKVPEVNQEKIEDVIVGNATPEAEQGLNVGRLISLIGLDTVKVPGMTVNRYCSSGLESIAIAASKIHSGIADCIIAGGVETISPIPFGGWRIVPNPEIASKYPEWYWNMGVTAEAIVKKYKVSREDSDEFACNSHKKAANAIKKGLFKKEIVPVTVKETIFTEEGGKQTSEFVMDTDEGPRGDTTIEGLAKLKPVFAKDGTITAGNASQTSDGAAFVMVMSERMMNELKLNPVARLVSYAVAAVEPKYMGMGPVEAVPKALTMAGLKQDRIELFELNEAFACQALAVIRKLKLNNDIVNVNGGAVALGHPLGCTGTKLTVQLLYEMKRKKQKYGMVTMCIGTGQGAAGVFEML